MIDDQENPVPQGKELINWAEVATTVLGTKVLAIGAFLLLRKRYLRAEQNNLVLLDEV